MTQTPTPPGDTDPRLEPHTPDATDAAPPADPPRPELVKHTPRHRAPESRWARFLPYRRKD